MSDAEKIKDLRYALKAMLRAEWMVTPDWCGMGERLPVLNQARRVLRGQPLGKTKRTDGSSTKAS